ncbi:MAG: type II secretion system protein [Planctomycetota bacterium]|jgi:prepilin-type N-terminal cleavage/methylation domain-containing protein/prepilin-type processing-associated H-X9-DG protein
MRRPRAQGGFTLLEIAISLALIAVLLAVLIPALRSARVAGHRSSCAGNHRVLGQAWALCLEDHDDRFPVVSAQPAWRYGGVRFNPVTERPYLDADRPLNPYLPSPLPGAPAGSVFRCPADGGITGPDREVGTGRRTAYRSFGTSYRANGRLLESRPADGDGAPRGLSRGEITTPPSRLVLVGDPVWFEVAESTGRLASWHGATGAGNILFLDGRVKFMAVRPREQVGPAVFDPVLPGTSVPDD